MNAPAKALAVLTGLFLVVGIVTAVIASSQVTEATNPFGSPNTTLLRSAANLAALSNVLLIFAGVGVVGLMVISSIRGYLTDRG